MRRASSLSNRIFLACTLLATLSLGFAFYFVNASVTSQADAERSRRLIEAAELAQDQLITSVTDTFTRQVRLVADLPTLKATVDLGDPPTMQPLVEGYRTQLNADLVVVTSPRGVLGRAGDLGASLPVISELTASASEHVFFLPHSQGLLQLISVPIQIVDLRTEVLGRLTVGVFLDHERALQFKRLTNSDVAFGVGGRIQASSLSPESHEPMRGIMAAAEPTAVTLGDREYFGLARAIAGIRGAPAQTGGSRPVVIVLRARDEGLAFLTTLQAGLAGALLVAVLLATVVSYVVARTITRPLAAVTGAMADVAATGDLTRRVTVQSRAWDDEDARLLASAFNKLTESIAVFRRQESQRERLSSLGRLSTVVAHEIRNPLMIIRASLRALHRDPLSAAEFREAVADIDEETERLNRIVSEVLDFAKPIRFDLAETSINDVCRASAAAANAGSDLAIDLDLDSALPPILTDAERLRTAFVNILTNARHAVEAVAQPALAGTATTGTTGNTAVVPEPTVTVRTRRAGDRILVTIADSGIGISPEDMAHVFDPYFTTRRAGTGLGLPISKNIVEGLGGTIDVASRPGEGTAINISLPMAGAGAAA